MTARNRGDRPARRNEISSAASHPSVVEEAESNPEYARELAAARLALSVQQNLKGALEKSGLDRTGLAKSLGLSLSAVCQVVDGDGNLRVSTIARYARQMGYQASLRLDPVTKGTPTLGLALPANVATRAVGSHWSVMNAESGNVWVAQTQAIESTTERVVFETVCTSLQSNNPLPTQVNSEVRSTRSSVSA